MKPLLNYLLTLYFCDLQYALDRHVRRRVLGNIRTFSARFAGGDDLLRNCRKSAARFKAHYRTKTPPSLPNCAVLTDNSDSLSSRTAHQDIQQGNTGDIAVR